MPSSAPPILDPPPAAPPAGALRDAPWPQRLAFIVDMVREVSRQTDPQTMVSAYSRRMRQVMPSDASMSLSHRGLEAPWFRITRSSRFTQEVNPWKQADLLPLLKGGLLADLIYGNEPVVIDHLEVDPDDPAAEYLVGHSSLVAIPLYDGGDALNMVVLLRKPPAAFDREGLPEHVWLANLFGRATTNLVLSHEVKQAYEAVDRELRAVADIQRSLLPTRLPEIAGLEVAAHYQTSRRAGGDYYDFFPLPEGRWGILIADVSGHGTPAAVLMAITHSIAHTAGGPKHPPGQLLSFVNDRLASHYTNGTGNFVTAWYGVWDPASRSLTYASAGHPPPRLRNSAGGVGALDGEFGLPLGILSGEEFPDNQRILSPGDAFVLYTDGITESRGISGEMFDMPRLDAAVATTDRAATDIVDAILEDLESFTANRPADDDRTLLVAKVRPS